MKPTPISQTIPQSLKLRPQWCVWDYVERPDKKPLKRPRQYEPEGLMTFADAWDEYQRGGDGIGYRFFDEDPYTGIDIDNLTDISRKVLEWARKNNAYIERSVSGKWHIIVTGSTPRIGPNPSGVEMYSSGQFFVMTGIEGQGSPDVDGAALLTSLRSRLVRKGESNGECREWTKHDATALEMLSADDGYEQWLYVGMAMHAMGAPFELWHAWSKEKGPRSYVSEADCRSHWDSFSGSGIGSRTFEWYARSAGWNDFDAQEFPLNPEPPVTALSPLPLVPFDELADAAKEPDWIVEGLLERDQLAVLVSHRGRGKTFLAMDLVAHIATGKRWFGRETCGGRVLYVTSEGPQGFKRRAAVFREQRFDPGSGVMVYQGSLGLGAPAYQEVRVTDDMNRLAACAAGFDLVVIDTISRNVGWLEENSNGAVAEFLSIIQRKIRCAVLLVGHTPKSEALTVRGASAWEGNTDVLLTVEPHPERDSLVLDVPRVRDSAATQVEFRLVRCLDPRTELTSMLIEEVTPEQACEMDEQRMGRHVEMVYAKVTDEPQSTYQICRALHGSHRDELMATTQAALDTLMAKSWVEKGPDTREGKSRYVRGVFS